MQTWDWTPYLVGGGTRADAITGLDPAFNSALASLFGAAPEDIRTNLRITSAFRSPEVQQQLYSEALEKYGSEEEARRWVAPPGRSRHNHGSAVDLNFLDPRAQEWVHNNAAAYGLHFPMSHEPWHVEPVGSRDAPLPAQPAAPTPTSAPQAAPMMVAQAGLPSLYAQASSGLDQVRERMQNRQAEAEQRRQALLGVATLFGSNSRA